MTRKIMTVALFFILGASHPVVPPKAIIHRDDPLRREPWSKKILFMKNWLNREG